MTGEGKRVTAEERAECNSGRSVTTSGREEIKRQEGGGKTVDRRH